MINNDDQILLKCNIKRFLKAYEEVKHQTTTKGTKPSEIKGSFLGFKIKATFGQTNLVKRPALAFLKDDNKILKGIYPIIVIIPDKNELIICKGVSYDNKPQRKWKIINEKDIPLNQTIYNDKKGQFSYFRNSYSLNKLDEQTIEEIIQDITNIIEDY